MKLIAMKLITIKTDSYETDNYETTSYATDSYVTDSYDTNSDNTDSNVTDNHDIDAGSSCDLILKHDSRTFNNFSPLLNFLLEVESVCRQGYPTGAQVSRA